MCLSTRVVSEVAGWRIVEHRHNTKTEKHRGENQKAWNQSQIAKSNAGLQAAGGYGTAAAGADPTAGYKGIVANPISETERAGALSAAGSPFGAAAERAGERMSTTRNSAGYGSLLDQLARNQSQAMGQTEAGLQSEAFNRRLQGLKGLQGVYGTNVGAQTSLLRPGQPVQEPRFWDDFLNSLVSGGAQVGAAALGA